ncbi:hypothetical protein ABQE62_25280 [Mycolicibacterium fortuitum]
MVDTDRRHIYWTNMGAPGLPADHPLQGEDDLDFWLRRRRCARSTASSESCDSCSAPRWKATVVMVI